DAVKWTSNDNRAFDAPNGPNPNLLGGLVSLTVPVGEPGSVSTFTGGLTTFTPGGFPSCTADLEFQGVACTGLVPGGVYTLTDRGEQQSDLADATGTVVVPLLSGVALTGQVCPTSGHARGLPSANISHTDELSGGQTETEVPDIADTSPMEGETMYGRFTALAESAFAFSTGEALPTDAVTR